MIMIDVYCSCRTADRRKAFNLISSQDHCRSFSPSQTFDTLWSAFEPLQNLSSDFAEWSFPAVIITTSRHHKQDKKVALIAAQIFVGPFWVYLQDFTKRFDTFSPFTIVSLHHKRNKSKLLSEESECNCCLSGCWETWDLEFFETRNFQ